MDEEIKEEYYKTLIKIDRILDKHLEHLAWFALVQSVTWILIIGYITVFCWG